MKAPLPSSTVTAVPEPNADRSFFESILPFVSGFTEDQKLEFRCEVLSIIRQMRIPQQNTSHINLAPQQRYTGYSTYQSSPNLLSSPTPHCSNYLPQTPSHQSSTRIPELQPRPPPAPLSQAPALVGISNLYLHLPHFPHVPKSSHMLMKTALTYSGMVNKINYVFVIHILWITFVF